MPIRLPSPTHSLRTRGQAAAGWPRRAGSRRGVPGRNSGEFRYGLDSAARQELAVRVDPDNRLLWRMPLKRLESEIIRDCVLSASGCLDATAGGPPIMLEWRPDGMVVVSEKQLP